MSNHFVPSTDKDVCRPTFTKATAQYKNSECVIFTINLGNKQNRIDWLTAQKLHEIFDTIENTEGEKACVITAEGKFFSNGLDTNALSENPFKNLSEAQYVLKRLLTLSVPTVAAVNGHAFGAGAMIALACDYFVMNNKNGFFSFPEIKIGMNLSPGTFAPIKAKVSRELWAEMVLASKRYTADELFKLNIVNHAVSPEEVVKCATDLAKSYAQYGANTWVYKTLKEQLYYQELDLFKDNYGFALPFIRNIQSKM